ncbi:MAG: translocation/assembly module TamB domain-containing protein [Candidatus Bipolaricaulia bacterium]
MVGTVLLLAALLLLGLQTDPGATAAAQFLARQANPLPRTTLTVERASGSWIRSLRLVDVSLTRTDSASGTPLTMAHVDTLAAQYDLKDLLWGRVHLTKVRVRGPSVTMRQAADSTWDWLRLMPSGTSGDTSTAGGAIQIDRIRLAGGQFTAKFYAGGRDSTARIRNLALRAHALTTGPSPGGHLDTLGLRAHLPADTTALRLGARGELSASHVRLDTLHLTSQRSRVRGHGTARLPEGPGDTLENVALHLRADPLVLRDLTAFLPGLDVNPRESIALDADLTGSGRRLMLDAEAQFSGGGSLTAHAEATPWAEGAPDASPLRYVLDAEVQDLTTSLIGPLDTTRNALSGTIDGSLRGPALTALSGTVEARLTDTRLQEVRVPTLRFRSTVQDGTAEVRLTGTLNGTALSLRGSARPFADAPSMDLTAQVRDFSLSTVLPAGPVEGVLAGTVQVEGQSMATETARYDIDATLRPSRIGLQPIEAGNLSLSLRPDRAQATGSLTVPHGRLRASGHVVLDGSEEFVLDSVGLKNVDVAALVGDTTESRVTGSLQARGQGFDPQTAQARAAVQIRQAQYGPHRVSQLTTTARLDSGQLTAETSMQVNGGTWTLAAKGRPFAPVPSATVTEGRFQAVDIGPFLQDTTQSSALFGTIQGHVRGTTPDALRLDARLTLDSSRVNRQRISRASAAVSLQDSTLRADLSLDSPHGAAQFVLNGRPFASVPRYHVSEGSFENLDVGAIAGVPDLTTQLSGALTMTVRDTRLPTLALHSELTFRNSSINQASLSEGRLTVAADDGRLTADGRMAVAGGALRLSGHLDSLDRRPSYALRASARSIDADALVGLDTTQARLGTAQWTLTGRGTALTNVEASTRFSAGSIRADRLRLDSLRGRGTLRNGLLSVDTFSVSSNAFEGQGQGSIALVREAGLSDFSFRATVSSAAPLRRLLEADRFRLQEGQVDAQVFGAVGQQRIEGRLSVEGLAYEAVQLGSAQLSFTGRRGTDQLLGRMELKGTAEALSVSRFMGTQVRFDALYNGTSIDLSADVQFDRNDRATLEATLRPQATPTTLRLRQLTFQLGPDRWSLQQETTIVAGDNYSVDRLLFRSGAQQIAVDGTVAFTGRQSLIVTAENVRLGPIAPLVGFPGLAGTLAGTLTLTGTASDPTLDGTLDLDFRTNQSPVGTLRLEVGYNDFATSVRAKLTHTTGPVLTAEGSVPADLRLRAPTTVTVSERPIRFDASTRQFPINWIDPFLDPSTLRSVEGTLSGDISIRGTPNQPALSGTASVSDAGATVPPLGTTYRNGSIALRLAGDQITLTEAAIESSNGGTLRAKGSVSFPRLTDGEYDLKLSASNLLAIDTQAYRRAVIDGNVTLQGTVRRPNLTGQVRVERGSIYYTEAFAEGAAAVAQVSLRPEDRLVLQKRFGLRPTMADTSTFDPYEALALDLTVRIDRNTWLRSTSNPELNVQFAGNLTVQKSPNQDLEVFGTVRVIEGQSTVRQFGQEFQITDGTLSFSGNPADPLLDLTAVYERRARGTSSTQIRITLSLEGRLGNLSTSLSSEPSMSTRNILSYLATGRPADAVLGGGSGGDNIATQVALSQAANLVESLAANELGLDVVRLQVRAGGRSYFTFGRYLTPRFFVSVEQPVTDPSAQGPTGPSVYIPDVTLEYRLTDYLLLRSLSGRQALQFNLLLEYSY